MCVCVCVWGGWGGWGGRERVESEVIVPDVLYIQYIVSLSCGQSDAWSYYPERDLITQLSCPCIHCNMISG